VEDLLGQAISRDATLRQKIKIITKCGIKLVCEARPQHKIKTYDCSKEHILQSVANSLKAPRTSYIDLLLIHRPDAYTHPEEIATAFRHLKKEGTVHHFGVSNYTPSQFLALKKYLNEIPIVTNQTEFGVMHTTPLFDGTFDQMFEHGIIPQVYSPLGANGKLFDANETDPKIVRLRKALIPISEKYKTSIEVVTLAWALKHPSHPGAVIGTTKWERVQKLTEASSVDLTREEWFIILEAAEGHEVV